MAANGRTLVHVDGVDLRYSDRLRLSFGGIAEAGVQLADARGLPTVTLRAVAAALGVTPMALYRYVDNKGDLLVLMADAAFGAPAGPTRSGWRDVMRWYAGHQRRVILDHPWLVHVPPRARTGLAPRNAALLDRALESLRDEQLSNDEAIAVVDTVAAYAHGSATPEAAQRALAAELEVDSLSDVRAVIGADARWLLETGNYPALAERLSNRRRADDMDWRFKLGLNCVLDGLAVRLEVGRRQSRRHPPRGAAE